MAETTEATRVCEVEGCGDRDAFRGQFGTLCRVHVVEREREHAKRVQAARFVQCDHGTFRLRYSQPPLLYQDGRVIPFDRNGNPGHDFTTAEVRNAAYRGVWRIVDELPAIDAPKPQEDDDDA